MNLLKLALVSTTVLAISVVGCKKEDDDSDDATETLGSTESQLIEDDAEDADAEGDQDDLDDATSGALSENPGDPADGASDEEVGEKMRKNPGGFFKPAGCLESTRAGNKITHVFKGCSGPFGLGKGFDGTVTTTYVRADGKLTVTLEASGMKANGATITGTRVVEYTRANGVITKHRTGSWSGTTAKGKEISHTANFTATYNVAEKCITRDGSAQTTIGGRSFERTVDGFKRCGIGRLGCPEQGGKITLSRTKSAETLTLTIEFLGGVKFKVTRPNGKEVTRALVCNPRAS